MRTLAMTTEVQRSPLPEIQQLPDEEMPNTRDDGGEVAGNPARRHQGSSAVELDDKRHGEWEEKLNSDTNISKEGLNILILGHGKEPAPLTAAAEVFA